MILYLLCFGCIVYAALQDTAAMTMGSDLDTVLTDGIVNELLVFR